MFIRKLFKIGDKGKWLFLELVIVFVGVYLAFLFQSYNENQKVSKEKDKVLTALKYELEYFRTQLPGRSRFMKTELDELLVLARKGEYSNYSDWIFLEPQYDFQIVEYALSIENTDIIDFDVYDKLTSVYGAIKRLEHAEKLMMEMSQRYVPIPKNAPSKGEQVIIQNAKNLENFKRFVRFMSIRVNNLKDVAERSETCLELVNNSMYIERRKQIEADLIHKSIGVFKSLEEVQKRAKELFPDFSDKEIEDIYNKGSR